MTYSEFLAERCEHNDFLPHKKKRQACHLTVSELARKSGVSKSMISYIELNQKHPTVPVLHALAKALKTDIKELYHEI